MKTIEANGIFEQYTSSLSIQIPLDFKGSKITTVTTSTGCRELAIGYLGNQLREKMPKSEQAKETYKAKRAKLTKKARAVFSNYSTAELNAVKNGTALKTLHVIEEKIGLPKTIFFNVVICNADGIKQKSKIKRIMFVGHNKWMRSSHTLSLWLLLIRLGIRTSTFRVATWKTLEKKITGFQKSAAGTSGNTIKRDQYYARRSFENWIPLMTNIDKIFPPSARWVDRYNPAKVHTHKKGPYTHSIGSEGIMKLATNRSQHKGAPIFYEVMKQEIK